MRTLENLICPVHKTPLEHSSSSAVEEHYSCEMGCSFPVRGNVPRFVSEDNYASAFGWQWNRYAATQLDSCSGTTISRDRLTRCLGGDLSVVSGKTVLEAGCGSGRFSEILLGSGALTFSCDLSIAVEANFTNFGDHPGHFVCQGDIRKLPVPAQSFDFVVCIGVVQHTPDPEETIRALASYVKPGGMLIIDHYTYGYDLAPPKKILRWFLLKFNPQAGSYTAVAISKFFVFFHRLLWRKSRIARMLRTWLMRISPLVDYYDAYPQLGNKLLSEWCVLDTHDTVTDFYKHLRSAEEICSALEASKLEPVSVTYGGNGVEARATRHPNAT
ncbi:class I SAM-dependent methyltransferase [Kiloniella majae]|uniref:class I SAM-dependent methyltransferase n=1 Tax=Kiloniella majae TaxID=1938558 RepID=UPI000A278EE4|nr:class I SAM-dependent methyltransferase [Kiloniella majae]